MCGQEQLDAYIPDPHFRQRAPHVATQECHKPHTPEQVTVEDVAHDKARDSDVCPHDKWLKLEARRHEIGHNIDRRCEADASVELREEWDNAQIIADKLLEAAELLIPRRRANRHGDRFIPQALRLVVLITPINQTIRQWDTLRATSSMLSRRAERSI
jgi:hypothetical protein